MKKYHVVVLTILLVLLLVVIFKFDLDNEISYREAIKIARKADYEMNAKTPKMEEIYYKYLKDTKTYASKIEYDGKSYYKVRSYIDLENMYGGAYNFFIDSITGEIIDFRIED